MLHENFELKENLTNCFSKIGNFLHHGNITKSSAKGTKDFLEKNVPKRPHFEKK
jgi:hypothetical protein